MNFSAYKFDFTDEEVQEAASGNRLLSLEIEFNRQCNYRCPYCYAGESQSAEDYDPRVVDESIEQAAELGAKKIVILGGEPLLYRDIRRRIERINGLGMGVEIFTNGSLMTDELAKFFYDHGCRVVVKFNSNDPERHDRLTGVKNSKEKAIRAFTLLQAAGYPVDMLCASSVISSENIDEIVDMWIKMREFGVTPYFEIMTPQGRLLDNRKLEVDPMELKRVFSEICEYDRRHGYEWEAQPPLVGSKCLRHKYSALVNARGDVFPCVGIDRKIGNILERPLRLILSESIMIQDLKNHREMIKGPCRTCERSATCYGCRGAAYQLTGDYLASDPLCWRNVGRIGDIEVLPVSAERYLPHRPPMAMIERIHAIGPESVASMTVRETCPFLGADGVLHPSAIPEIAAQAAAAVDSFRFNGAERPGFLVSVRNVVSHAEIRTGDEIFVSFRKEDTMPKWFRIDFELKSPDGKEFAKGEIDVCLL